MNASKIEKLRKQKNLTQKQFAEKINITTTGYINLIQRNDLKVSVLEKIAKVLGVPVSYFFENEQSLSQIENKEFDEFLNKYIRENESLSISLSDSFSTIHKRVECGFIHPSIRKLKFEHILLQSITFLGNSRNEFLFKNNSEKNLTKVLIKNFDNISIEQKKKYFIYILEKNKELAELIEKILNEFLNMLHDENNEYAEGSIREDNYFKKYFDFFKDK